MTHGIPENVPTWLADWSVVTIMDNIMPPRDPDDDDDDADDEDHAEPEDDPIRRSSGNPTNSPARAP